MAVTTKPKLRYFDAKGRAEPSRLAFYLGGIDFEDDRLSGDDFSDLKPSLPFGQLPVLEVNGKQYAQSGAIVRYAGRLSGLYSSDPIVAMKIDEIFGFFGDVESVLKPLLQEQDEQKKAEIAKNLREEKLPAMFANLEKRFASWGGPYSTGEEMTIADLLIYVFNNFARSTTTGVWDGVLDRFSKFNEIVDKVGSHPKVKEWNAKLEN